MDKLQWFKFSPTDWIMGKIQRCPETTQARFLRLICLYWNKECILSYDDAEIEIDKEHLDILIGKKIIKIENDFVVIDFLNEQLDCVAETSQKRREAVLLRWAKVKQKDTSVPKKDTIVLQIDTEESRVDESKQEKSKKELYFDRFWNLYGKKVDTEKSKAKFLKLSDADIDLILGVVEKYVLSTPDKQYRKNPLTWLNGKCWNDLIIEKKETPKFSANFQDPNGKTHL